MLPVKQARSAMATARGRVTRVWGVTVLGTVSPELGMAGPSRATFPTAPGDGIAEFTQVRGKTTLSTLRSAACAPRPCASPSLRMPSGGVFTRPSGGGGRWGAHTNSACAGPRGAQVDVSTEDAKPARGGAETQQRGSGRQGIAWLWRFVAASALPFARCNSDPQALLLNTGLFPLARRMPTSSLAPSGCTCWGTGAGLSAGT